MIGNVDFDPPSCAGGPDTLAMTEQGKKQLGRILLEQKAVEAKDLDRYLKQQEATGERLASIISR